MMLLPLLLIALAQAKFVGQAGPPTTFMLDARTDVSNASQRFCLYDSAKVSDGWTCSKWFTDDPASETSKHYQSIVDTLEYFSKSPEGLPFAAIPAKGFNLVVEYNKIRPELKRRAEAQIQALTKEVEDLKKMNSRNCTPDELKRVFASTAAPASAVSATRVDPAAGEAAEVPQAVKIVPRKKP